MGTRGLRSSMLITVMISALSPGMGCGGGGDGDADPDAGSDADVEADGDARGDAEIDDGRDADADDGADADESGDEDLESCGDGFCGDGEDGCSCAEDCPAACGDGCCTHEENACSCEDDCEASCGDGCCTHEEDACSCEDDCERSCGDSCCSHDEDACSCDEDCDASCGDGCCTHEEDACSCEGDCIASCGDGCCSHDEDACSCEDDCEDICGDGCCTHEEDEHSCDEDCRATCGDGCCSDDEYACSCRVDCGPSCGDGCCSHDEKDGRCPDCPEACGDGFCGAGEDLCSCPADCTGPPTCGDGCCSEGETACMCEADCALTCGDGCCTHHETDCTCDIDCDPTCGDGCCSLTEDACSCALDCEGTCGDGCCSFAENAETCPEDCVEDCGDGFCTHGEDACSCRPDCDRSCGDGCCTHRETVCTCREDCGASCGDGCCTHRENACSCSVDCPDDCGDGCCTGGEDARRCPEDCVDDCGDGLCGGGEDACSCQEDCDPDCGDGCCTHDEDACSCRSDCRATCGDGCCTHTEDACRCRPDCEHTCGDGCCTHAENAWRCPDDCPSECGDGRCTHEENFCSCADDCPSSCGDGCCDLSESICTCDIDCESSSCGDGCCTGGETACSCESDCGGFCGDGCCTHGETACSCADDCEVVCGDVCCSHDEDTCDCDGDCVASCGDGCCTHDENIIDCQEDCALEWRYIGPGGFGAMTAIATDPRDPDVIVVATDVAGVFVSSDGGESFENRNDGLETLIIFDIAFSPRTGGPTYLGTTAGVYVSDDLLTWRHIDTGMLDYGLPYRNFSHPIQTVAVVPLEPDDPDESDTVWAGIGSQHTPHVLAGGEPVLRPDACSVYVSTDGGESWTPSLHIDEATVFEILVHPTEHGRVWVASNRGLYLRGEDGVDEELEPVECWLEIGVSEVRASTGFDEPWVPLSESTCRPVGMDDFPATDGLLYLPIIERASLLSDRTEEHPNLRDLELLIDDDGNELLYVTVWDRGYEDVDREGCIDATDGTHRPSTGDPDLDYYRGGPYVSRDGGLTFEWLLTDHDGDPLLDTVIYRCFEDSGEVYSTSHFWALEVDPSDPEHFFVGVWGPNGGIHEFRREALDGGWHWWGDHRDTATHPGVCPGYDCYEGGEPVSLAQDQTGPYVRDMEVLWALDPLTPPVVRFASRGALEATWDDIDERFVYNHLHANSEDPAAEPPIWSSTGLDDTNPLDIAWLDDGTGTELMFLAVGDGGVLRSDNGGLHWQNLGLGWRPLLSHVDDSRSVLADEETSVVYASNYSDVWGEVRSELNTVLISMDLGDTWEVIGGHEYCTGEACTSADNGLRADGFIWKLAIDYSSPSDERRILASSSEGLYSYDPTLPVGSQWDLLGGDGAPAGNYFAGVVLTGPDIVTGPTRKPLALVTVDSDDDSEDGIYAINLVDRVWEPITGGEYWISASHDQGQLLALSTSTSGETFLIVSTTTPDESGIRGGVGGRAVLYTTPFNLDAPGDGVVWRQSLNSGNILVNAGLYDGGDPCVLAYNSSRFRGIAVSPVNPAFVVAGAQGAPTKECYPSLYFFVSRDAGQTFAIEPDLQRGLPTRDVYNLVFDPTGSRLFALTNSSLWVADF